MELLGGLSFLGHLINNNDKEPQNNKKNKKIKLSPNNIYDNKLYKKSLKKLYNIAKNKSNASKNPEKSGIIPPYYNSNRSYRKNKKYDPFEENNDSEFSDIDTYDGRSCDNGSVNLGDPLCFIKNQEKFKNINKSIEKKENTFLEQFEPLKLDNAGSPSASNNVGNFIGDNGTKRLEIERNIALNGGFSSFNPNDDQTYGIVSKESFVHNNMQPFFSSKDGGFNPFTEKKNAEFRQRRMESFTGSANNLEYRPKTERKTLFDPVIGLTNNYGTPVLTDFMDSRFIPGMERRGEKPFQEVRITPGLNLGYNEVAKFGFHDVFRVLPKTVDELRIASKPKTTFGSVVIPGMKGQKGSIPSKMYKRRPLTFWETKPSDYIRGQSYIKAPTIHADVNSNNLATVNRGVKTTGRLGGAKLFTDLHKPDHFIEKTKISHKENFKNDVPRNAHNNQLTKGYIYDGTNWIPDPNMRNIHDRLDRAGQMGNNELNKGYIYDGTNWIPDPNMRNIHDRLDRAGQMGNNELNKGYIYDGTNWIPDPNMRNIHDRLDRAGQMGNNELNKGYIYDGTNWIPDPNMRNIHDRLDRAGQMGNGELNKGYIYDGTNWIPDPNMRNIHDRLDRAGQMGNNELNRGYIYDGTNWIPDPNMRNIHDRFDRAGQMGNGEMDKPFVFDMINNIQDPTMRNIHDKFDRAGQMGNGELDRPFVFDMINNIQDPTMRNIHDKFDRIGNGLGPGIEEKQRSRGDANNMRLNGIKEIVSQGRTPTNSGYSKGPTVDFTMMNLKEPLNFNREIYPDIKQTTTEKIGWIGTRSKQTLPQQSFRFYSHVDDNLSGNPLVNNVIHKSNNN